MIRFDNSITGAALAPAASTTSQDLSFDQIDDLLKRAESRLQEAADLATTVKSLSASTRYPQLRTTTELPRAYVQTKGEVAQAEERSLVADSQRMLADKPKTIKDPQRQRELKKEKAPSLEAWHSLPLTVLTPELKRDFQLLNMRSVLDPKRMYKKQGKLKIPEYSQVGTLIEGPSEFYSARMARKERTETFVEDAMAREKETGRFRQKAGELIKGYASGKKGHYKQVKAKRKQGIDKRFGRRD